MNIKKDDEVEMKANGGDLTQNPEFRRFCHDIKNPLAALQLQVEVLEMSLEDDDYKEKLKSATIKMKQEISKMVGMLDKG